ncbi:hypothetical protein RJ640_023267 [Escallonia rubra]|uniref:Nephrocystin-3 n=1 Tax=Escallonia rubra TaxID=112253 RepID=A0AA88RV52_9ASTE|nr:hypothetical protein RJ640_023267 [Escallonia rubra]
MPLVLNFLDTNSVLVDYLRSERQIINPTFVLEEQVVHQSNMLLDISRKPLDNELEIKLQELFNEVKSLIRTGNRNDALDLLQANFVAVKEHLGSGGGGIEEAAIVDVIALGYMAIGDLKMVGNLLDMGQKFLIVFAYVIDKEPLSPHHGLLSAFEFLYSYCIQEEYLLCLNKVVDGLTDDEPILDSVLMHMGSMYSALGKFEQSILLYRRALAIIEREYGSSSTFLIPPLLGLGKVLGFIGRATKAVDMYQRAISILESSRGLESEKLVVPLFALGNLLIKDKATDAESPFMRILNIYTKLYGANDGRVGMAMCSVANAKCAKGILSVSEWIVFASLSLLLFPLRSLGDVDEAIQLYREALQVLKDSKYVTLDDDMMEKIRIDLAELLHEVGRAQEGQDLLEECLLITEKYRGKEHPSTVTHLINLATSYSRSKNFVEAERLLRTSLRIMMKSVGPDDQSITFPMLHLAVTLYNLHKHEEAEQLALEVLHIRETAFGKESPPVGEALDCLVSIQSKLEKDDSELLELLKRVLRIQEKAFGPDSEEVMETLIKIVYFLDKMGRRDEKFPLQKRLSMLRNKYKQTVRF